MKKLRAFLTPVLFIGIAVSIAGCMYTREAREVTADRIARPAFMVDRTITAGPFKIYAWERMHEKYQPATVYIEGDGPYADPAEASVLNKQLKNPTPPNPVGLNLAAMDKSRNLAWLGRPCQYEPSGGDCPAYYWKEGRYAPEILDAYQSVLDEIKARYSISEFTLIGYGGGAVFASALAGTRDDVACLKTVAGVLDPYTYSVTKNVSLAENSVNPVRYARTLSKVPQVHFIGGYDDTVPAAVFQSYRDAIGDVPNMKYRYVADAGHDYGWQNQWPGLLGSEPDCSERAPRVETPVFSEPPPEFWDAKK